MIGMRPGLGLIGMAFRAVLRRDGLSRAHKAGWTQGKQTADQEGPHHRWGHRIKKYSRQAGNTFIIADTAMHPLLDPIQDNGLSQPPSIGRPSGNPQASCGTPNIKTVMIFAPCLPCNAINLRIDTGFFF